MELPPKDMLKGGDEALTLPFVVLENFFSRHIATFHLGLQFQQHLS